MKDYKSAFEIVTKLYESALKQNEKYFHALQFYADQNNWQNRNCSLLDQGAKAKMVLSLKEEL